MEIICVLAVVLGIVGAVRLGPILRKYQGVFGVPKAYIVACCLCVAAAGVSSDSTALTVLFIIVGIALSFGVSILLTRRIDPLMWFLMIVAAFGWCLRFILHFVGIAMPVIASQAEADLKAQQAQAEAMQRHEAEKNEIQNEAYRKYGTRGQVSDDNSSWRPDSNSDWIEVHKK